MGGILAGSSRSTIVPVLIEGLRRLDCSGYDSCGVAVVAGGELCRERTTGGVTGLDEQIHAVRLAGLTGLAHIGRAARGTSFVPNSPPIFSLREIAVVLNGVIENAGSLTDKLRAQGYAFVSQMDTEAIAHLIHSRYQGDLAEAVRRAMSELRCTYAIAALHRDRRRLVVGACHGSPLWLWEGERANLLTSDPHALASGVKDVALLQDGDVCTVSYDNFVITDRHGRIVERRVARPTPVHMDVRR